MIDVAHALAGLGQFLHTYLAGERGQAGSGSGVAAAVRHSAGPFTKAAVAVAWVKGAGIVGIMRAASRQGLLTTIGIETEQAVGRLVPDRDVLVVVTGGVASTTG